MDSKELAKKPPMATPGFTVIIPKTETEYDKKIQAEQEKQLADCCGDDLRRQAYNQYGYKPHPQETSAMPESKTALPPERKNSKRDGSGNTKKEESP